MMPVLHVHIKQKLNALCSDRINSKKDVLEGKHKKSTKSDKINCHF